MMREYDSEPERDIWHMPSDDGATYNPAPDSAPNPAPDSAPDDRPHDWAVWIPADGAPPPPPPPPPPPRRGHAARLLAYLLVAVVAACVGAVATVALNRQSAASPTDAGANQIPAQHNNAAGSDGGSSTGLNQAAVERKVDPGLVDIQATLRYNDQTAEGTGMIVSPSGLVLTNNHVINNSTSVDATLVESGRTYQARVVGYDATDDVALLRLVGASGLPVVTFGNSSQVSIGAAVLALGNAQGRGGVTPAPGIIDALGRSIDATDEGSGTTENLHNMEQTSAQIQQGDSGGALANNAGQVIGMITAANSSSGQADGTIGFAIPINSALTIARQIASGQSSSTVYIGYPGFLGVVVATSSHANPRQQAVDEQNWLARQGNGSAGFGAPGETGPGGCIHSDAGVSVPANIAPASSGALIVDVFCRTAVEEAGLVAGDVITAVNGEAVTVPSSLGVLIGRYHPGDAVSLSWVGIGGVKHTRTVTLGPGPVR
jgi:S1-C subfamily serine protease